MRLSELDTYLNRYLELVRFDDDSLNGLQVEGRGEVKRLATSVSACAEAFRKAVSAQADALIVHHGLFWRRDWPSPVTGILRERIKILLDSGCSLFAYHLPLDAHPEVGNNAVAARDLGLKDTEPFAEYHGTQIGVAGRLAAPLDRDTFINKLETYYGHRAHVVPAGPDTISSVGIVSGGAAKEAEAGLRLGLDAYVTGEPGEPVTYLCREGGINFAAMGHYATERVGVQALGGHIGTRFGLETFFIEVENEA